ncbi:MAG: DUF3592 domain-containing protein [Planctomycetales bacterium]|nr:DUF3592 domain-containing protein [Planctomycetales bacterium]
MAADKSSIAAVKNNGCLLIFMGVWLTGWMLGTLLFDGFLAYFAVRQCWAYAYASTQGTVTSVNIESDNDGDGGTTYTPQVNYVYMVNGQNHQGSRINYLLVSSSHNPAQEIVNQFPVGKPVTVYYSSANPQDSVLVRGLDGMGLFMGIFLLPFNVIGAGIWYAFFSHIGPGKFVRRWLHFRTRDDGLTAQLTIYTFPPLMAGLAAASAAAFAMTFIVGFGMNKLPVFWLAIAGWTVVMAAGVFAWQMAFRWSNRLSIDLLAGKLEFQESGQPRTVFTKDVREIFVKESSSKDDDGNVKNRYSTWMECQTEGRDDRFELCTWSGEDLAEWVRKWLSVRLRKES